MKRLLLVSWLVVSCAPPVGHGEKITYRYVNTLDFGNDNSLDAVRVTGYDEQNTGEATRLEVSVADSKLIVRDLYSGDQPGSYLYNPGVALASDGALIVTWSQMGDVFCRAEIVKNAQGKLVERKRTAEDRSR